MARVRPLGARAGLAQMNGRLTPEHYRRIASEFRVIGSGARDPKQAADALKMAEDYERMAIAVEAELSAQSQQLADKDAGQRAAKDVPTC